MFDQEIISTQSNQDDEFIRFLNYNGQHTVKSFYLKDQVTYSLKEMKHSGTEIGKLKFIIDLSSIYEGYQGSADHGQIQGKIHAHYVKHHQTPIIIYSKIVFSQEFHGENPIGKYGTYL